MGCEGIYYHHHGSGRHRDNKSPRTLTAQSGSEDEGKHEDVFQILSFYLLCNWVYQLV